MQKAVKKSFVVLWASVYLLAKGFVEAVRQTGEEMEATMGTVSLIQVVLFIILAVFGFGWLGLFLSVLVIDL